MDTNDEVLAVLEAQLQFPCEYGSAAGPNPKCRYAADWSATVHDCALAAPCGCPKLFCEWHYLDLTKWIHELLLATDGNVVLPCGFVVRQPEDFVWQAQRLH